MKDFKDIHFKWTFRKYQQRVLDNSSKFLSDSKINIVAAPGSGKTILGLEMIRRLNAPCIIFSPTITIREQWGERFKEAFLDENLDISDYVSNDLNEIKLINSITYQALHSVINKVSIDSEDEILDYSNIDLFKLINENNIKTICLDEAHHLQNEWQKALEKFIKGLDKNIKIISLTATPPYDANASEWARYVSVCGEIDDEIFVPELVKEGTLCPHQDYVAFNYPTEKEMESFKTHNQETSKVIEEIKSLFFLKKVNDKINEMFICNDEFIYTNFKQIIAIMILLKDCNIEINQKLFLKLTGNKEVPSFGLKYGEVAFQFLIDDSRLLEESEKEQLLIILKSHSLIHRRKVQLCLSEKLKKMLVTSSGKLNAISKIVESEYNNLKDELRMLILTDYIKKESVANIGTNIEIDNISVVSIFEEIRRKNVTLKLGCLSGTLVILPTDIKDVLAKEYGVDIESYSVSQLRTSDYQIFNFKGDNKEKVRIISKLFEDGYLSVLIGTASLLGEGWDSPCINSLILASYVGSFMLSNQMRGRAIRTYKKDPDKTANIWHLVTLEPNYNLNRGRDSEGKENTLSSDYDTLSRRFDCFVGPNYENDEIESGIERITFIKPPYDKQGIENINNKMFELSNNRQELVNKWKVNENAHTIIENRIPKELQVPPFNILNVVSTSLMIFINLILMISLIKNIFRDDPNIFTIALLLLLVIFLLIKTVQTSLFIIKHITPCVSFKTLGKAILKSFKATGLIDKKAKIKVKEEDDYVSMWLSNACIREQNMFNTSIEELLKPMDNPRYIILKKNKFNQYNYHYSFACPSLLAVNNRIVEIIQFYMNKALDGSEIKYGYSEEGKRLLVKCRKKSYIALDSRPVIKRQKVSE